MVERGQHLRLALDARQPRGVAREGVGERLDRDVAPEARVARAPDLAL
jgi:hypothetical protein